MRAPRSRAASSSSSTRMPAPSPITKPSRRRSNGREMPDSLSASIRPNAAVASGVITASLPPVTTASASPQRISRSAMPIAWAPAAHADTVPNDCPRRSCFIATTPEAAFAIRSGIERGEMRSAPSDPGADHAGGPVGVAGRAVLPAGVLERLLGGGQRQLREAVGAAHLLDGEVLLGVELARPPVTVVDPGTTGGPALVQGTCADAERRDGADAGDGDGTRHPIFDITRSTA